VMSARQLGGTGDDMMSSKGNLKMTLSSIVLLVSSVKYTGVPPSIGFLLLAAMRSKVSDLISNRVMGVGLKANGKHQ